MRIFASLFVFCEQHKSVEKKEKYDCYWLLDENSMHDLI